MGRRVGGRRRDVGGKGSLGREEKGRDDRERRQEMREEGRENWEER